MAYTIIQAPNATVYYNSLNSALWHVVNSSNNTQPDFRYVFDVTVVTTALTLVSIGRFKISPDADGNGVINLERIVRAGLISNYFTPVISTPPIAINTSEPGVTYVVEYGEEYSTSGVLTVYPNVTNANYRAWNDYNPDTITFGDTYIPSIGMIRKWYTSRDITDIWMPRTATPFLSYLNLLLEDHHFEVQEITADRVPVGTASVSSVITGLNQMQVLTLNVDGLNSVTYASGPATPIPTTAAGFRIRFVSASFPAFAEWAYVRFLCEPKVAATPLHFMNRFGGFDTFYFQGPTRRVLDVDQKTYQRMGVISSIEPGHDPQLREYDFNTRVYADTTIAFHNKHGWSRKLSSGYVDDATHNWLWELAGSSQVFFEGDNQWYYPVQIKTRQWSEKRVRFDKLYNLDLEITMNRQVFAQRR